jgi:hypothetical protein
MKDQELASILKYSSPKELYIITYYNVLKLLKCPFRVKVLRNIGTLKKEQLVFVDEVKVTTELKTIYIIENCAYHYSHFDIIYD